MIKGVEIYEDTTRKDGRRLVTIYRKGPAGDTFVIEVKRKGFVAYVEGNRAGEESHYYPQTGRLEFWDKEGKIPASTFGECTSYGQARKPKAKVRTPRAKHFSCTGKIMTKIEYFDLGDGWVKLNEFYSDGTTSGERLQVLKGDGYIKLQRQDSQEQEKIFGAGYFGNHVRYYPERNQLHFWSHGGGKLGPAKMYMTCQGK